MWRFGFASVVLVLASSACLCFAQECVQRGQSCSDVNCSTHGRHIGHRAVGTPFVPYGHEHMRAMRGMPGAPAYLPDPSQRGAMMARMGGFNCPPQNAMPHFGLRPLCDWEPYEPRHPFVQKVLGAPKPLEPVLPQPSYTTRGPRDFFLNDNPSSIGY